MSISMTNQCTINPWLHFILIKVNEMTEIIVNRIDKSVWEN